MMMQLGADWPRSPGICPRPRPGGPGDRRGDTFARDPEIVAKVSRGLGEPMVGIAAVPEGERLAERGWQPVPAAWRIGVLAYQGDVREHLPPWPPSGRTWSRSAPGRSRRRGGPGRAGRRVHRDRQAGRLLRAVRGRAEAGPACRCSTCAGMILLAQARSRPPQVWPGVLDAAAATPAARRPRSRPRWTSAAWTAAGVGRVHPRPLWPTPPRGRGAGRARRRRAARQGNPFAGLPSRADRRGAPAPVAGRAGRKGPS